MRALLLLPLLIGPLVQDPPPVEPPPEPVEVDPALRALERQALPYAQLRAHRGDHLGHERVLVVQLAAPIESWEPYLTRFGPECFVAHQAWADEQFPWIEADFRSPAVRLFTRRGSEVAAVLAAGERHQRFALRVVLREVLAGRCWIEVLEATRLPEEIGEGSLLHAAEALRQERAGAFALAADQARRALAAPLPAHARAALEALDRRCRARIEPPGRPLPLRPPR